MMVPMYLTFLSTLLASTSAAAVGRRDRTCTVELDEQRGQVRHIYMFLLVSGI